MQTSEDSHRQMLNAQQLRSGNVDASFISNAKQFKLPIYLILCDVIDTFNVGTAFRLADALGVKQMWLTGKTECPPNPRIDKASVGTDRIVDWQYSANVKSVMADLRNEIPELKIYAVEQCEDSLSLYQTDFKLPIALILGNESAGIDNNTLIMCDGVIEIPMLGVNKSMNVIVSCGMVMSQILGQMARLQLPMNNSSMK